MREPPSNPEIDPELRKCYGDIRTITRSVDDLVHDLTDAELVWKPHPGPWSIAQCLEHMAVTARADLPHLLRAIDEARSQKLFGHGPFRYGSWGWLLIKAMDASARFKFKAPRVYRPAEDTPPREVILEFFTSQQEILDCIVEGRTAKRNHRRPIQRYWTIRKIWGILPTKGVSK